MNGVHLGPAFFVSPIASSLPQNPRCDPASASRPPDQHLLPPSSPSPAPPSTPPPPSVSSFSSTFSFSNDAFVILQSRRALRYLVCVHVRIRTRISRCCFSFFPDEMKAGGCCGCCGCHCGCHCGCCGRGEASLARLLWRVQQGDLAQVEGGEIEQASKRASERGQMVSRVLCYTGEEKDKRTTAAAAATTATGTTTATAKAVVASVAAASCRSSTTASFSSLSSPPPPPLSLLARF